MTHTVPTIDEYTEQLYARGGDAEVHALTLIRCLGYDHTLILDHEAYRAQVRTILSAMERARERRVADRRAELDRLVAELTGGAR